MLGARVTADPKNYSVGESRLLELAEEGISFLSTRDSRKPVGFADTSLGG